MFVIRPSRPEDLAAIKTLLADCGLPHQDLTEEHLKHFIVLAQSGRVFGSVGLEIFGNVALLRSLSVDVMLRGDGLGKRLLDEIQTYACGRGIERLYLLTNSAASFFAYHGFQPVDRSKLPMSIKSTPQFGDLCPASSTCMFKALS